MECRDSLLKVVDLVRGQLTKLQRATLGALVVMDVHARDVVTDLADNNITNESDFDWQAQLRSYWVEDTVGERGHTLMMHMMSAELEFGCALITCMAYCGRDPMSWTMHCVAHVICRQIPTSYHSLSPLES